MSIIITNAGRNAIALALANDTSLTVTEIAFGTNNRFPTGGEATLETEVIRKPVLNYGVTGDGKTYFDARLEAEDGPFVLYEVGLFASDGTLLFIGRIEGFNKLVAVDQPLTLDFRAQILTSQLQNVVVQIDTSFAFVSAERQVIAGHGLTGTGDLSGDVTLALDFSNLNALAAGAINSTEDTMVIWDASAGGFKSVNLDSVAEKAFGTARFETALATQARWRIKSAAYTAKAGERVAADVSDAAWALKLPAVVVAGDVVYFRIKGAADGGPYLTVDGNGNDILGDPIMLMDHSTGAIPKTGFFMFSGTEWEVA